jgi:hypothetical protein
VPSTEVRILARELDAQARFGSGRGVERRARALADVHPIAGTGWMVRDPAWDTCARQRSRPCQPVGSRCPLTAAFSRAGSVVIRILCQDIRRL